MIYVVSPTSSFRPILYPPFTCSSPGVISEVSLLVAMPQRVHQRQYFRIQNSRTDSRSIRSRFFITVCSKRKTFSANPVLEKTKTKFQIHSGPFPYYSLYWKDDFFGQSCVPPHMPPQGWYAACEIKSHKVHYFTRRGENGNPKLFYTYCELVHPEG